MNGTIPLPRAEAQAHAEAGATELAARDRIAPKAGLAVEDSVVGVRSAVAAGCPTVGNLLFVQPAERAERAAALEAAGVLAVVDSWQAVADLLLPALRGDGNRDLLTGATR